MLKHLDDPHVSADIAALWRDPSAWRSLFIDYEHPHVERLYATLPGTTERQPLRVMLHRIHPCEPGQSLMHAHPWPSAVKVLSGRYEHTTRAALHDAHSEVRSVLAAGSAYEILSPHVWHSVRPLGSSSCSIMLAGAPWQHHHAPKPAAPQRELTPAELADMRQVFEELFWW